MPGIFDVNVNLGGAGGSNGDIDLSTIKRMLAAAVEFAGNYSDTTNTSLTNYVKRSMIASRVFIQREVAEEEILPDLLMTLQQMYVGWVLTAMQMNTYVDGTRTIKKALNVVATENIKYVPTDDLLSGLMSFNGKMAAGADEKEKSYSGGSSGSVVDTMGKKELNLPSGRIIEVKFNPGGASNQTITVNLYLQLMPTFIPSNVAREFFHLHFKPSSQQRYFQVTAGEKRFIADYLFEMDLLRQRNRAMKDDKTGLLKEMLDRKKNGLLNFLLKLGGVNPERQNIANTIHIYEKASFDRWCHDAGCDFKRFDHRTKFFNRTFSMVVAVVDSSFGIVDIYLHGIDNRGEYKFNQIHQQASSEKYDLQSIMKAYYSSSAPKF